MGSLIFDQLIDLFFGLSFSPGINARNPNPANRTSSTQYKIQTSVHSIISREWLYLESTGNKLNGGRLGDTMVWRRTSDTHPRLASGSVEIDQPAHHTPPTMLLLDSCVGFLKKYS
ncbi:hypothetical protein SORBI_3001G195866 [Sorghum bicolor]|uniref:Uncharacterized protein n=1 Tax=Sorghum bicolor TaxID=4558 RepID=A0A1Z5S6F4_SORBI|nr:hypothetical protein SORBI_3001G195866 [Sorghum bicolor]